MRSFLSWKFSCLLIIGLLSITISGWALIMPDAKPEVDSVCTKVCPDGTQVTCEGSNVQGVSSPVPGCVCDGKKFLCAVAGSTNSNANAANVKPDKKKDKIKNKNSNTANAAPSSGDD